MRQRGQRHSPISTLIILCLFAVAGCSAHIPDTIGIKSTVTEAELLSGESLFNSEDINTALPEARVMELSETMREYLRANIPEKASKKYKFNRLVMLMFAKGNLGITYDPSQTLTAENTFRSGSGNCLGVSYLFASMAKEIGLTVNFQNVKIPPMWGIENETIYRYRHVNVEVVLPGHVKYIVDVNLRNNRPTYNTNIISIKNAVAQYYSNKGGAFLAKNDALNAFLNFKKAITIDPSQAEFWSNLGVLYINNGKPDYAEAAYLKALERHSNNLTTFTNMSALYEKTGQIELWKKFRTLAERENNKNPYLRYIKASKYFEEGDYSSSLSHIKWAIGHEKDEPKFYHLMARIYVKTGHAQKADSATLQAQKVERRIIKLTADQNMRVRFFTRN